MKKILIGALTLMALVVFPQYLVACECSWGGPFRDMINKGNLVFSGKVLKYVYRANKNTELALAMDVEVKDILLGEENRKEIRIWGDNGMLCRPYVSAFPLNTEWIFNVTEENTRRMDYEDQDDYVISMCGEYWLELKGKTVSGKIKNLPNGGVLKQMLFNDFKELLQSY